MFVIHIIKTGNYFIYYIFILFIKLKLNIRILVLIFKIYFNINDIYIKIYLTHIDDR